MARTGSAACALTSSQGGQSPSPVSSAQWWVGLMRAACSGHCPSVRRSVQLLLYSVHGQLGSVGTVTAPREGQGDEGGLGSSGRTVPHLVCTCAGSHSVFPLPGQTGAPAHCKSEARGPRGGTSKVGPLGAQRASSITAFLRKNPVERSQQAAMMEASSLSPHGCVQGWVGAGCTLAA